MLNVVSGMLYYSQNLIFTSAVLFSSRLIRAGVGKTVTAGPDAPYTTGRLQSLDWTGGLDRWTGLDWTGLDWTGMDWTRLSLKCLQLYYSF